MGRKPAKRSTLLARWIDDSGESRETIAKRLDIPRTSLDRLCRGARRPGIELAFAIEKMTKGKVPAEYWSKISAHSKD